MSGGAILLIIGSLAVGVFGGFVNSRISKNAIKKKEMSSAIGVNAVRFVVDIVALVIVYVIARIAALSYAAPLLACAIGLTVGGMLFLTRLTRQQAQKDQPDTQLQGLATRTEERREQD